MQASVRTCWVNCTCKLLLMIQALVCQFPTRKWWFISGPPGGTEGALCSAYISRSVTATDTIALCHMLWFLGIGPLQSISCQWQFFVLLLLSFLLLIHFFYSVLFLLLLFISFFFLSLNFLCFLLYILFYFFIALCYHFYHCFVEYWRALFLYTLFPSSSHLFFLYRSLHFAVPSFPSLFPYN